MGFLGTGRQKERGTEKIVSVMGKAIAQKGPKKKKPHITTTLKRGSSRVEKKDE